MSEIQKIAQDIVPELRLRIDNWLGSEMMPGSREYVLLNQELFENKIGILRVLEHSIVPVPRAAQEWQDISTAPKNRRIGLMIEGEEYIGRWEDDRYAQKPRPYWQHETFGRLHVADQRGAQPSAWRELRSALIADERGTT